MRTVGEKARFPEDLDRQYAWTVQKNSRKDMMADHVKRAELESPHQKICKIAEKTVRITRTAVEVKETASP